MSSGARKDFISGIQAELPILVGVIPFGMIYGALAISAGIPALQAQSMSAIVFAGSAQFITAQLVHLGAPGLVIFLTVGVVNLRHALYSASLAPFVKHLPLRWKVLLAYLLTDEAYAVTITHYLEGLPAIDAQGEWDSAQQDPAPGLPSTSMHRTDNRHFFFLGSGLALWTTWQLSTAAGILVGEIIPQSWSLDFTLALTFIALVVPNLKDSPAVTAALSAGVVAVLAASLPYKLGLFLAAMVGVVSGMLLENRKTRSSTRGRRMHEMVFSLATVGLIREVMSMSLWITMIAAGLLTIAIRLSFMFLWGRLSVPDWLQRAMRFVPPAVLSAIIFPEIFVREGQVNLHLANPRLIAGVVAALVGWRSKNIVWTIAAGMLVLWLIQALPV